MAYSYRLGILTLLHPATSAMMPLQQQRSACELRPTQRSILTPVSAAPGENVERLDEGGHCSADGRHLRHRVQYRRIVEHYKEHSCGLRQVWRHTCSRPMRSWMLLCDRFMRQSGVEVGGGGVHLQLSTVRRNTCNKALVGDRTARRS